MFFLPVGRGWRGPQIVLALLVSLAFSVTADEGAQEKQRLKWMRDAVDKLEPESLELKTKESLTFAAKPLLRYSDPTRGLQGGTVLLDGSVWRLGIQGRPTALVTIEIYEVSEAPGVLSYEFLSLTGAKFSVKHKEEKILWEPTESGLTLKELPDGPKPASTASARLVQMRKLARRFTVKEQFHGKEIECRLLTQPIDRYQAEADKIVDGAILVYVNSTNPEVGVVIETDGNHWFYGTLRLTASEAAVALGDRQVAGYEDLTAGGTSQSYHNGSHGFFDRDK
ncbi:MAG TPA: hypothetical protein VH592_16760 [Gemmataceae bacterium]